MTIASRIEAEEIRQRTAGGTAAPAVKGDVLIGEDWVAPEGATDPAIRAGRRRRGIVSLNRSPLARKIIVFNLMALIVLVAGVLFLNPFRDSLVLQREQALVSEARLIAGVIEARMPLSGPVNMAAGDGIDVAATLERIALAEGAEIFVFDPGGRLVGSGRGDQPRSPVVDGDRARSTIFTDFLNGIWNGIAGFLPGQAPTPALIDPETLTRSLVAQALAGETAISTGRDAAGGTIFSVATPILHGGQVAGAVALASAEGEIDRLVHYEREQVLRMFVLALMVSVGLSLVLASTIANPLSDLAAAA